MFESKVVMDRKVIVTFVKRIDLMEFRRGMDPDKVFAPEEYYSKQQDVRLVVTERIAEDGRIFCRINCPINPLPVKGEFEIPNWGALKHFLTSQGWKQREVITESMFHVLLEMAKENKCPDGTFSDAECLLWSCFREALHKGNH